jgi:phage gp36-like protein
MGYCTQKDVRDMIKDDALNAIIGDTFIEDPEEREVKVGLLIDEAIADADGEIDGYLAKRYPTPIAPVPKVINKFAKDMAVYNLFSRRGIDENSEEKNFLTRYNAAIKFLTFVAEGKVSLGAPADNPKAAASTGFKVASSPRLFSREQMRGM